MYICGTCLICVYQWYMYNIVCIFGIHDVYSTYMICVVFI